MCGIFGIIGTDPAAPKIAFKGLTDIEYRGYDSWGLASWKMDDEGWRIEKKVGFLPSTLNLPASRVSIGHTRWATHGGVTETNAHPHTDCLGKLVLVHNGIVENYLELKNSLKKHKIKSETDTEVIVHLIEEAMKKKNFKEAVSSIFRKIEGLNAFVVSDGHDLIACKKGSPLVVGQSENGFIIASDPNALLPHTSKLLFLEDNQMVRLNNTINLYNGLNKKILPKFTKVSWSHTTSDLKKYPHYMLKEIYEQPKVIQTLASLNTDQEAGLIKKAHGTYFLGCGSAAYAAMTGVYLFSKFTKKHVNFSLGSEFNYSSDFLTKKSLLVAISQSGETIDVVEPVSLAREKRAQILAVTNTLGSTLYRMADKSILLNAGVEKAVCATKTFTSMISVMITLSLTVARKPREAKKILLSSAKEISSILRRKDNINELAERIYIRKHIFCLGRGLSYPVALESALKIKEIAYIHAEGFAAGELKHGVIALIEQDTPVIVFVPDDETRTGVLANAMEVKARGAYVIGVGPKPHPVFDFYFPVKDVGASSILPNIVFSQLLAYFLSVKHGLNPDKPRNLAKSVVVR